MVSRWNTTRHLLALSIPGEYDNDGQRLFFLHPLTEASECGGAEDDWNLTINDIL